MSSEANELLARFAVAANAREVETIAEALGKVGDRQAIRPLLLHLGDPVVHEDARAEAALCRALVALGVMCRSRDDLFQLRARRILPDDVVATIREVAGAIPWQYFGNRAV